MNIVWTKLNYLYNYCNMLVDELFNPFKSIHSPYVYTVQKYLMNSASQIISKMILRFYNQQSMWLDLEWYMYIDPWGENKNKHAL